MLNTPYYNTKVEISATSCGNMSSSNYLPYNLFCLTTQMEAFLAERKRPQSITCVTIEEDGRMALKLRTTLSGEEKDIAQEELNNIISNRPLFCLLYSSRLEISYPNSWVREMLPYISVPNEYSPFVLDDSLYVNLALSDNFLLTYNLLLRRVNRQIKKSYNRGFITEAKDIRLAWSLRTVDVDESLFVPTWQDKRFAPQPTEFLLSRLQGDRRLTFILPSSLPIMHNVALVLSERKGEPFYFIASPGKPVHVVTKGDNLQEAQEIADLIENAAYSVIGEVYTESFSSKDEAEKVGEDIRDSIIYINRGESRPFILSVLQGFNLPSPFEKK